MPLNNSSRPKWWREDELAQEWRLSVKVLQKWRRNLSGPAYYKLEGAIRYRLEDIETFEKKNHRFALDSVDHDARNLPSSEDE